MAKTKYVTQTCVSCNREAKMETIGVVEGSESKVWYRCTRCHHSMLIDKSLEKPKEDKVLKISRDDCIAYSPEKIYDIGTSIYHTELDDMGRVIQKVKTSSGASAILVSFEKIGERRLIENLAIEE